MTNAQHKEVRRLVYAMWKETARRHGLRTTFRDFIGSDTHDDYRWSARRRVLDEARYGKSAAWTAPESEFWT